MFLAAAALALAVVAAPPAEVTGRWEGSIAATRPDGTIAEDSALMILEQKGATITGTIGGNDGDQHPVVKGSVEGGKVTLQARHTTNDREYLLELTIEGDEMKGTVTSGERKGTVTVKRKASK
jgi:hypothetical protein